ncbi:peptidase MA family metallohydrolase [Gordonia sp. NPDC003376]
MRVERTHAAAAVATLAVALTVGLTACGGTAGSGGSQSDSARVGSAASGSPATPTTSNVYLEQRTQGVGELLDRFSGALVSGREDALTALIDEAASPGFRGSVQTAWANLSSAAPAPDRSARLRVRTLRYQLAPTEEAETLVPATVQERLDAQGSTDSWVAPVELHFALGGARTPGIDEDEVVVATQLVVARYPDATGTGDSWRLVGDASLVGGPVPPQQIWSVPGLAVQDVPTSGGTSVIASYPDTEALDRRVAGLLPGAIDAVSAFWGTDWARRAVVVTTATDDQFGTLAGSGHGVDGAAAATVYSRIDVAEQVATGQRVILTPQAADLAAPTLGVVLRHELTHVATRSVTDTGAPMWLTEGVPEYVGRKGTYTRPIDAAPDLAAAVRDGHTPTALPADDEFAVDAESSRLAYQSAWSVAAFVADRFGEARLKALYTGVAATGDTARQDVAIRAALGIDRTQLVARWRAWLEAEMR